MVQELWALSTFSTYGPRQNLDQIKNDIFQSPGLDLVKINVFGKFHQYIS